MTVDRGKLFLIYATLVTAAASVYFVALMILKPEGYHLSLVSIGIVVGIPNLILLSGLTIFYLIKEKQDMDKRGDVIKV